MGLEPAAPRGNAAVSASGGNAGLGGGLGGGTQGLGGVGLGGGALIGRAQLGTVGVMGHLLGTGGWRRAELAHCR